MYKSSVHGTYYSIHGKHGTANDIAIMVGYNSKGRKGDHIYDIY